MMIVDDINEIIQNLQAEVEHYIPSLNCGGCGVFALEAYRALRSSDIKVVIVALEDRDRPTISMNKETIKNIANAFDYEKDELAFPHAWLYLPEYNIAFDGYEKIYADAKDVIMPEYVGRYHEVGFYEEEELDVVVKYGLWNSTYQTKHNSKLKELCNNHLNLNNEK